MAFRKQISDPNVTQPDTGRSPETDDFDNLDRNVKGLDVITDTRERLAKIEEKLKHLATKEELALSKVWSIMTIIGAVYCTLIGVWNLYRIVNLSD